MDYEDRITIPTPEGVSLELTLAGFGSRAVARAIDLAIKGAFLLVLLIVASAGLGQVGSIVTLSSAGLMLLIYDIAFEVFCGGRTPGKRAGGLRVVRASGRPIDPTASVVRNLLRLVDGITLSYVPTIVSILATRRNQRLGDLAADTVVIRDRREIDRVPPAGAFAAAPAGPPDGARAAAGATWDVSAIPAGEIATVRAFLERRDGLAHDARKRLATQLDGALRPRVGGVDERDPERFLEILYAAKRERG